MHQPRCKLNVCEHNCRSQDSLTVMLVKPVQTFTIGDAAGPKIVIVDVKHLQAMSLLMFKPTPAIQPL